MCTASCDPRRHGVCPTCRPHGASLHHWWCIPLHELIKEGNIKKLSVCWYMYTFTWCCVCPDTEFFLVHFNPEFVCYCYVTALIASSLSHDLFKCQLCQYTSSVPSNEKNGKHTHQPWDRIQNAVLNHSRRWCHTISCCHGAHQWCNRCSCDRCRGRGSGTGHRWSSHPVLSQLLDSRKYTYKLMHANQTLTTQLFTQSLLCEWQN